MISQQAIEISQRWPVTAAVVQELLDVLGGDAEVVELALQAGAAFGYREQRYLATGKRVWNGVDVALDVAWLVRKGKEEQDG